MAAAPQPPAQCTCGQHWILNALDEISTHVDADAQGPAQDSDSDTEEYDTSFTPSDSDDDEMPGSRMGGGNVTWGPATISPEQLAKMPPGYAVK